MRQQVAPGFYPYLADTSKKAQIEPQEVFRWSAGNSRSSSNGDAVELTRQPGIKISQVARDLGIRDNILSRWRREIDSRKPALAGSGSPRDEEEAALKRELARVKKERDFLRDAAVLFAKGSS